MRASSHLLNGSSSSNEKLDNLISGISRWNRWSFAAQDGDGETGRLDAQLINLQYTVVTDSLKPSAKINFMAEPAAGLRCSSTNLIIETSGMPV